MTKCGFCAGSRTLATASRNVRGLLTVETDKVTVEIEAPGAGVLLEQKAEQDQFAKSNEVVAVIEALD
jgi:pyruvate/2-oxoglutarate dehydrogenase complex dihydrolipoamide acyltransferase (E2) component